MSETATEPTTRQRQLRLSELRQIFHEVDKLATGRMTDREIFRNIQETMPFYQEKFTRWLVRHTLHPEAEDDIMPDEVEKHSSVMVDGGYNCIDIFFTHIPPTVEQYLLVQYDQQFWQIVEFSREEKRARLKPLNCCAE